MPITVAPPLVPPLSPPLRPLVPPPPERELQQWQRQWRRRPLVATPLLAPLLALPHMRLRERGVAPPLLRLLLRGKVSAASPAAVCLRMRPLVRAFVVLLVLLWGWPHALPLLR